MKRRELLLIGLASLPASAQTSRQQSQPVYRCGADGRELSDRPCAPGAQASSVRFDQPSEADAKAARQRARDDAKAADALAAKRRRDDAKKKPGAARLDSPPKPPKPNKTEKQASKKRTQKDKPAP